MRVNHTELTHRLVGRQRHLSAAVELNMSEQLVEHERHGLRVHRVLPNLKRVVKTKNQCPVLPKHSVVVHVQQMDINGQLPSRITTEQQKQIQLTGVLRPEYTVWY